MKASVEGRIRNTNLPKTKALLPLFEAVINGFQAIEEAGGTGHSIEIRAERRRSLVDTETSPFESFAVTDTGIGFTDANYDSFETVDSRYRARLGGKGLGRFSWLKAFSRVEIDSHYRVEGLTHLMRRTFEFVATDEDKPCVPTPSEQLTPRTTVRLVGYQAPYIDECPRQLDLLAQRIVAHFLPLMLDPNGPALSLADADNAIDLRDLYRKSLEAHANIQTFKVGNEPFKLIGFRLKGALAAYNDLVYGAHYREVLTEHLGRHLPNLKDKLVDKNGDSFAYVAFVESPFLDEKVNSDRSGFSIPAELVPGDIFPDEMNLKAIRDTALTLITAELQPYLEDINAAKKVALERYVVEDGPQYHVLIRHQDDFIDQIPPDASKAELENILHKQLYTRQVKIREEGNRILSEAEKAQKPQEYYTRFQHFVENLDELGKSSLAQYIVHRRIILELLEKAISQDPATGKYGLEKTVHALVFPMHSTSSDVPFELQNLWIIDERLTYHSFLSSDLPLTKVPILEMDSEDRPDILIFDQPLAFGEDSKSPLTSMVIIEFKRPERETYPDENPVDQVYRMVRQIQEGHKKDYKGREIRVLSERIPAYCYVICDLTRPLETKLQNMGAFRTPDNSGYYGFNPNLSAYYEVISYEKLLGDAKKRNRAFFEKLNLPTTKS